MSQHPTHHGRDCEHALCQVGTVAAISCMVLYNFTKLFLLAGQKVTRQDLSCLPCVTFGCVLLLLSRPNSMDGGGVSLYYTVVVTPPPRGRVTG